MSCDRHTNNGYADWYLGELVGEFKKYCDYILRSKDDAKDFLIRAKILDKKGKLTEYYKNKE